MTSPMVADRPSEAPRALAAFSADSHIVEPPDLFDHLETQLGSRAPQVLCDRDGRMRWLSVGSRVLPVGRRGLAGHDLRSPETSRLVREGYAALLPGAFDPSSRLADQDVDGVTGEVLYPSLLMALFSIRDRPVVHAGLRTYNDWIRAFCSESPSRLVEVACLPLPDVDAAVAELHRVADLGVRGVAIPCQTPINQPYHHPMYEPFWAEAAEIGLPISLHVQTGTEWRMGAPDHVDPIEAYVLGPSVAQTTIADLVCGGVVHRHEGLRFVIVEFETGWVPHFLARLDQAAYRNHADVEQLDRLPSDYVRESFWFTFEDDAVGIAMRASIGVDKLMWANDYPHIDSSWPNSQAVLADLFASTPEDERTAMVNGNVKSLYGLG